MRVVLEDEFVVVIVVVVVLVVVEVRLTKPLPLSSVFEIRNPKKKSLLVRLAIAVVAVVAGVVAATAAVVVADILFLARCFSPLWGRCDCSRIRQWRVSRFLLLVSAFFDGVVVVVAVLVSPRVIVDALEAAVAAVVVGLVLVLVVAVVSRSLRREPLWMLKKTTE